MEYSLNVIKQFGWTSKYVITKNMKTLKENYLENALKYAKAFKAIFEDEINYGLRYRWFSRMEKAGGKKCQEIFEILRESNRLSELEGFMLHENPYVRYLAANDCIIVNQKLAEKTLEELIESKGHKIQMHALTSLKDWRNIPWTEDRYK